MTDKLRNIITDKLRNIIGVCADCEHLLDREMDDEDGNELVCFKCLLCLEPIEQHTNSCSHLCKREYNSLFLTEEFRG